MALGVLGIFRVRRCNDIAFNTSPASNTQDICYLGHIDVLVHVV